MCHVVFKICHVMHEYDEDAWVETSRRECACRIVIQVLLFLSAPNDDVAIPINFICVNPVDRITKIVLHQVTNRDSSLAIDANYNNEHPRPL